jgi:hypothetical protein
VPHFEQAASAYRETLVAVDAEADARRRAAQRDEQREARIERVANELLALMNERYAPRTAARTGSSTLADLGRDEPVPAFSSGAPVWSRRLARTGIEWLRGDAAAAKDAAHLLSLAKRGRKTGIRHCLALWVGTRLLQHGVRLTKGADGRLARVLTLVYEVAGIPVPADMFGDVAYAIERLRPPKALH